MASVLFTLVLSFPASATELAIRWDGLLPSPLPSPATVRVQRERDDLLQHRAYLQQRLAQTHPLLQLVCRQVRERNLPQILCLLPLLESSYRLDVVSSQGAAGLWQLMPDTASRFGLQVTPEWDERYSLPHATRAALDYLGWLHRYFAEDWLLALAAYNAGEGRIRGAQGNQALSYWQLTLPSETMRYVPKLLALADIIQHADRYGVRLPDGQPAALTTAEFVGPASLTALTSNGRWQRAQLEALNPALRLGGLPATRTYTLVVPRRPDAAWPALAQRLGLDVRATDTLIALDSLADPLISHSARGLDLQRRPVTATGSTDPLGLGTTLRLWQQQ